MNILALRTYIEEQDEMSYPELSALLEILTKEMNTGSKNMAEGLAVYNLRQQINKMVTDLKKSMSKEEIEQEELAKQARRVDLQQYTEMAKRI